MSVVICRRAAFIASFSLAHVGGRSGIKRPVIHGGGMSLLLFLSLVSFFHPSFFLSLSVAGCSEREREGGARFLLGRHFLRVSEAYSSLRAGVWCEPRFNLCFLKTIKRKGG